MSPSLKGTRRRITVTSSLNQLSMVLLGKRVEWLVDVIPLAPNPSYSFRSLNVKKNWATNSGSPEVELRFCPWIMFILNWAAWPEVFSMSLLCVCIFRGARPNVSLRWQDLRINTRTQKIPLLDKNYCDVYGFYSILDTCLLLYPPPTPFRPAYLCVNSEPVFVNVYGSQKSIPRNWFLQPI
jgi:hypothetical protein